MENTVVIVMPTQTSEHSWTMPEVGGDVNQWGQILNDLFDNEIEDEVVLKDTYANRPGASGSDLKLFLATDRRIVYYNDGSSWEAVYGLGSESNPVPGDSYFDSLIAEKVGITEVSEQPSKSELSAGIYSLDGQVIVRTED